MGILRDYFRKRQADKRFAKLARAVDAAPRESDPEAFYRACRKLEEALSGGISRTYAELERKERARAEEAERKFKSEYENAENGMEGFLDMADKLLRGEASSYPTDNDSQPES